MVDAFKTHLIEKIIQNAGFFDHLYRRPPWCCPPCPGKNSAAVDVTSLARMPKDILHTPRRSAFAIRMIFITYHVIDSTDRVHCFDLWLTPHVSFAGQGPTCHARSAPRCDGCGTYLWRILCIVTKYCCRWCRYVSYHLILVCRIRLRSSPMSVRLSLSSSELILIPYVIYHDNCTSQSLVVWVTISASPPFRVTNDCICAMFPGYRRVQVCWSRSRFPRYRRDYDGSWGEIWPPARWGGCWEDLHCPGGCWPHCWADQLNLTQIHSLSEIFIIRVLILFKL